MLIKLDITTADDNPQLPHHHHHHHHHLCHVLYGHRTPLRTLPFSICVIPGQLLNFSVSKFPHLPNENPNSTHF